MVSWNMNGMVTLNGSLTGFLFLVMLPYLHIGIKRYTMVSWNMNGMVTLNGSLTGFLFLVMLPYVHFGIIYSKFWVPDKPAVDKGNCTCSCWDTIFKGTYESGKRVGYKHMYFNVTPQTFCIWAITMAAVLTAYEVIKYIVQLYKEGSLRTNILFLILLDFYPHYFSWWVYVNYMNDDFYKQFYHQLFFSITEIVSTAAILKMCSTKNDISKRLLLIVLSINTVHILIGGLDQFFVQLILMDGNMSQRARSIGILIPDIFHIIIPLLEYRKSSTSITNTENRLLSMKNVVCFVLIVMCLFVVGKFVMK